MVGPLGFEHRTDGLKVTSSRFISAILALPSATSWMPNVGKTTVRCGRGKVWDRDALWGPTCAADADMGTSRDLYTGRPKLACFYCIRAVHVRLQARSETSRLSNRLHFELHPLVLLYMADDLKEVTSVRIASRSEHAHETLGRLAREGA